MKDFLTILFILISVSTIAKVEAPNYDFSVDKFKEFAPGNKIAPLIEKYKPVVIGKDNGATTYKFYVAHIRYKFVTLVQVVDSKITDFHARLPHYFLHDIFHQSLINRYGAQDKYKKNEESALYIWENKDGVNHVYSGACTITCFPIFYSAYDSKTKFSSSFTFLMKKMIEAEY